MESITLNQVKDFAIVLLAIAGFIVLMGNVIKTIKGWKEPADTFSAWKREVDRKLENDNKRLESIEEGNKVMTRGVLALISHEINGNSADKLKASQQEITNYLINR